MTLEEFNRKWADTSTDNMSAEELRSFKNDCFSMYESTGFLDVFNSPYDELHAHNSMPFKVVRRATEAECDLESMPQWLVQFSDGDTAYCYPEEICRIEKEVAASAGCPVSALPCKNRYSVIAFPAEHFRWVDVSRLTDAAKWQHAKDNPHLVRVFATLYDFQTAANEDSIDLSMNFIFFVTAPDTGAGTETLQPRLSDIQKAYCASDVCMAKFLASEPADGLSLKQAFELYVRAKSWADDDVFSVSRDGEVSVL